MRDPKSLPAECVNLRAKWLNEFVSGFCAQFDGHWLRHSLALTELELGWKTGIAAEQYGCGPNAFAALSGLDIDQIGEFFPRASERPWTNRREMEFALRRGGFQYREVRGALPEIGVCLVRWLDGEKRRTHPRLALLNTHWIAVAGAYVFDVNWRGWLPTHLWEGIVVEELLLQSDKRSGWEPFSAFEIFTA